MSRLGGFIRLMRPVNCFMMGIAVLVGALLTKPTSLIDSLAGLFFGFVTGFTLTAASMTINDYHDRAIDVINEPKRPIPGKLVTPRSALMFSLILTVIGFVAAYLTNLACLLTAAIAWAIFVIYTTVGKRSGFLGNLLVSVCVAIPFVYGSVVLLSAVSRSVFLFASMAFLANTGREITKGIVDVQGDGARNVRTLAVRFGGSYSAEVATFFYVLATVLSPLPIVLGLVSLWFIPVVAVTDIGLVFSSFSLLRNHSRENARKVKQAALIWFLFGLLAFVIGAPW